MVPISNHRLSPLLPKKSWRHAFARRHLMPQLASPKNRVWRIEENPMYRKISSTFRLGTLAAILLALGAAVPAAAQYVPISYDMFDFTTSNGAVRSAGYVQWYKDGRGFWQPAIFRGEYHNAWAQLQTSGCLYVQISWTDISGSLSWPPSATASPNTTSDGWYQLCGPAGTWVKLTGQGHASGTLWRSCISLAYSRYGQLPKSYQANHCGRNQ